MQFQKGLSEADFLALYGSGDAYRAAVFRWRWRDGFECPACGGRGHCVLDRRALIQCNACRTQTSLTAGTIFAATKLGLTTWFRAMYLVTQSKQGISEPALQAHEPALPALAHSSRASSPVGSACARPPPGR